MEYGFAYKGYIVAAALVLLFTLEHVFPAVSNNWQLLRMAKNFSVAFINFLMGPIIVLPLSAYAALHGLGLRPSWWNMAFDLLLLDGWIYAWHRLNHVLPWLWRFHEVHHLDEALDTTTALRFHFGEVVLSALVRAGVIWVMAIPLLSVGIFETLVAVAALFQHSNVKLPTALETWLARLIVTPRLHWVHHHAKRESTDSNYATVLSVWDVLFRSRSPNVRRMDMKMGVEGKSDRKLLELLLAPFQRRN